MEEFILPIPPIDEQQEIFRRVTSLFKFVDIIAQQYQQTKANIKNIIELLRSQ